MAQTERRLMSAEELWDLPDDGMRHELVRGELRTMAPAGWEHGELTSVLDTSLRPYVRAHQLGRIAAGDIGFKLTEHPDTIRAPDLAFISHARLPPERRVMGFSTIAPDLVVEIISPSDRYSEVAEKVAEWLAFVRLVILVDSRRRVVSVHRADRPVHELREGDVLDGEDVVPGWRLPVSEIFAVVPQD